MQVTIVQTIQIMQFAHMGQFDQAGQPYWKHPLRVMMRLPAQAPALARHLALLHDVIEDKRLTAQALSQMGYSPAILIGLDVLSKRKGEEYPDFIERVRASGNGSATWVKYADLLDNSAPGRMGYLRADKRDRLKTRYEAAKAALRAYVPHHAFVEGDIEL